MSQTGVLEVLLPDRRDPAVFTGLVELAVRGLVQADPVVRLAALMPQDKAVVRSAAEAMRLSNAERNRLDAAAQISSEIGPSMSLRQVRQVVYKSGAQTFLDRLILAWAASGATSDRSAWGALLDEGREWVPPVLPVNGDDAAAAGMPRGPLIGRALAEVEAWWLDRDFVDGRPETLEKLGIVARTLGAAT
jgi:poly(A) polymerase